MSDFLPVDKTAAEMNVDIQPPLADPPPFPSTSELPAKLQRGEFVGQGAGKGTPNVRDTSKKNKSKDDKDGPGTRPKPPLFMKIQPDVRGTFHSLNSTSTIIKSRISRSADAERVELEETLTRCLCREMIYRTEVWSSEFMFVRDRADDYSLGLPQDLMLNVAAYSPLKRSEHPAVIADPDYIKSTCDSYLLSLKYKPISGEDLVYHTTGLRSLLDRAMHRDVWTQSLPSHPESLLMHGVVMDYDTPHLKSITGPTPLSSLEEVRAAKLNLSPYSYKDIGYHRIYTIKIRNDVDKILALTSSQYSASAHITDEDYAHRCVVPAYRK